MIAWFRENGIALVVTCFILYVCITQGALGFADVADAMLEHNAEIDRAYNMGQTITSSSRY